MGLSAPLLAALGGVARQYALEGRLLALGVQTIRCDGATAARAIGATRGVCACAVPETADHRAVYAALGFASSTSVDLFPDEGPEEIVDLSQPLPVPFHGAFDAFLDAGTLEHVFDAPAALRGLMGALAPRGVAMHISPMDGFANHGFYQFGPKLFARLYAANGFAECSAWRIVLGGDDNAGVVEPIADLDAPVAPTETGARTLVLFAARRAAAVDAFTAPIDTHIAVAAGARAAQTLAPLPEVLEGLRALGFAPRPARGGLGRLMPWR
jgi:hypothetical protein